VLDHGLDWPSLDLGDAFRLHHHPETRVVYPAGWRSTAPPGAVALGITLSPSVTTEEMPQRLAGLAAADAAQIECFLHDLCGTYVLLVPGGGTVELYTDPAGMMTVFRGHGRVASSPTLLGPLRRDVGLDLEFPFGPDNDWYPGALTPFEGVTAVPANHVLDIGSGRLRRFWPTAQPRRVTSEEGIERLTHLLQTLSARLLEVAPVACSLTGGKDSRLNLAALREHHDRVEYFTVDGAGVKRCDLEIPAELARRFGLDHRFVHGAEPEPWLLNLYDEMTAGLSIGGGRGIAAATSTIASPVHVHLNGNLGAMLKSFFWPSPRPRRFTRRALSKEFVHTSPRVEAAIDDWVQSLPDLAPTTVYNLMYLEQRGGRWAAVGETASNVFYESVTLLNSREVVETICGLPVDVQYGGSLLVDLVRRLWPELLEVPYCRARRNWSTYVPRSVKWRLKSLAHGA
jgi:hypothetical protein